MIVVTSAGTEHTMIWIYHDEELPVMFQDKKMKCSNAFQFTSISTVTLRPPPFPTGVLITERCKIKTIITVFIIA